MTDPTEPRPQAGLDAVDEPVADAAAAEVATRTVRGRLAGPWRVAVVDGSMRPAIEPGDWLLVDPTTRSWPRRGSVVVFREPDSGELAIKRVAGCPGDHVPYAEGYLILAPD